MFLARMTPLANEIAPPAGYQGGGLPKGGVMIVVGIALYVLPTLLAWKAGNRRLLTIALVNLGLGWTVIGWIAAMVMTFAWQAPGEGETDVPHQPGGVLDPDDQRP